MVIAKGPIASTLVTSATLAVARQVEPPWVAWVIATLVVVATPSLAIAALG